MVSIANHSATRGFFDYGAMAPLLSYGDTTENIILTSRWNYESHDLCKIAVPSRPQLHAASSDAEGRCTFSIIIRHVGYSAIQRQCGVRLFGGFCVELPLLNASATVGLIPATFAPIRPGHVNIIYFCLSPRTDLSRRSRAQLESESIFNRRKGLHSPLYSIGGN